MAEAQPAALAPHRLRDLDRRQRIWLGLLFLALAITLGRVLQDRSGSHYLVVGDEAIIATRAYDAPSELPLVGKETSAILYGNVPTPFNPGPAQSYLQSPFVRAFGLTTGSWIFGYFVGVGAALVAAWAWFRTRGPRGGLLVLAGSLVMFQMTAPGGIASVLNTRVVVMPFFAVLLLSAAIALGDTLLLPIMVFFISFCVEIHIAYAPMTGAILLTAIGIAWWRRKSQPVPHLGRDVARAAVVGLICWLPVFLDQFFGSGNFTRLLRAHIPHSGWAGAKGSLEVVFNLRTVFLQRGELNSFSYGASWKSVFVIVAVLTALLVLRRDWLRAHKELGVLVAVLLVTMAFTASLVPPTDSGSEHFYWLRGVSLFIVLLVVLLVAAPASQPRPSGRAGSSRPIGAYALALVVLCAIAPLWVHKRVQPAEAQEMASVHHLLPAAVKAAKGTPMVEVMSMGPWPALAAGDGLNAALYDRGINSDLADASTWYIRGGGADRYPNRKVLVVTQGSYRSGNLLARYTPPAIAADAPGATAPGRVLALVKAHPPLRLVGTGPQNLSGLFDGLRPTVCIATYVDHPEKLLDLGPTLMAELYLEDQVAEPAVSVDIGFALEAYTRHIPTDLYVGRSANKAQPSPGLALSTSSC